MKLREHGTRAKYVAEKCRCDLCRKANREYAKDRMDRAIRISADINPEQWAEQKYTTCCGFKEVRYYKKKCPGLTKKGCPTRSHLRKDSKGGLCGGCRGHAISTHALHHADTCREHLFWLSANGFGTTSVMAVTGLSKSNLQDIRKGTKKYVLPETERKILAVKPAPVLGGTLVNAAKTRRQVRWLLNHGWTKTALAEELGSRAKVPTLQVLRARRVFLKTARNVKRIYDDAIAAEDAPSICTECHLSHAKPDRQARLVKMLPARFRDIMEEYPCVYSGKVYTPGKGTENRTLNRDLRQVGAVSVKGTWTIPHQDRDAVASRPSEPDRTTPSSSRTWPPQRSTHPSAALPPP